MTGSLLPRLRRSLVAACATASPFALVACTQLLGEFEVTSTVDLPDGTADASDPDGGATGPDATDDGGLRLAAIKSVTAGARHTCALAERDEVFCWGDNTDGQLARPGELARSDRPVRVTLPPGSIKQVVAGAFHACALVGFDLYCWGRNACGQLGAGDETPEPSRTPRKVDTGVTNIEWAAVAPGLDHTCAIEAGGATYCWGCNQRGQAGGIGAGPASRPQNAGIDKEAGTTIAASDQRTCMLSSATPNEARCWGTESNGELGDGPPATGTTTDAVSAPLTKAATALATGGNHTCAIDSGRVLWCWGLNGAGQSGGASSSDAPVERSGTLVRAVAAGGAFTCVIGDDNALRCFGKNESGELGRGGPTDSSPHPEIDLVRQPDNSAAPLLAKAVAAGRDHACAVLEDGKVVCWGKGADGQLGDGTPGGPPRTLPVFVVAPAEGP